MILGLQMIGIPRTATERFPSSSTIADLPDIRLARSACRTCAKRGRPCSSAAGQKVGRGDEATTSWWETRVVNSVSGQEGHRKELVKKVASCYEGNGSSGSRFLSEAGVSSIPNNESNDTASALHSWLSTAGVIEPGTSVKNDEKGS